MPEAMRAAAAKANMRAIVSLLTIVAFFGAYLLDMRNQIFEGALVAAFTQAIAYYLGSSQGAHENREQMNAHQDRLIAAVSGKAGEPE